MNKKVTFYITVFLSFLFFSLPTVAQTKQKPQEQYDTTGGAVTFAFKYNKGDRYRILSTVSEDVFVNLRHNHHAQIINRIAAEVTDTKEDGSATHDAVFMTSEESVGSTTGTTFTYGKEYKSIFDRNAQGIYTISDEFFMPTVRNVPSFPTTPVKPGDSWILEGHEAHDFRNQFGLQTPYIVPFTAKYTYLGTLSREKKQVKMMSYAASSTSKQVNNASVSDNKEPLHVFRVTYNLYAETPKPAESAKYTEYPVSMMGYSDELVYWDAQKGAIDHYSENFRILLETSYGNLYEFRGIAHSEVTEFTPSATENNIANVQKQIDDLGLNDITVKKSEQGLILSLENIKFKAESAQLQESEIEKLNQIARIISEYPDNDILVNGHTAKSVGGKNAQKLSEERAQTVANYLIELNVKDKFHIFTQGFGDSKPIAPNNTKDGMEKNRRVEIIIMDK